MRSVTCCIVSSWVAPGQSVYDHHRFDREFGVFIAPQVQIGRDPGHEAYDHEVDGERLVADRQFGRIEALHYWPSNSFTV